MYDKTFKDMKELGKTVVRYYPDLNLMVHRVTKGKHNKVYVTLDIYDTNKIHIVNICHEVDNTYADNLVIRCETTDVDEIKAKINARLESSAYYLECREKEVDGIV